MEILIISGLSGSGKSKDLQLTVMGGGHGADALLMEMRENGDSKCRALRRIRACAQLVKEHERVWVGLFQKRNHVGHMGGKGA